MIAAAFPAFADNPAPAGDAQVVNSILTRYADLVKKRGWMSAIDSDGLRAYRFQSDYDEIRVRITASKKDRMTVFTADFRKTTATSHGNSPSTAPALISPRTA